MVRKLEVPKAVEVEVQVALVAPNHLEEAVEPEVEAGVA